MEANNLLELFELINELEPSVPEGEFLKIRASKEGLEAYLSTLEREVNVTNTSRPRVPVSRPKVNIWHDKELDEPDKPNFIVNVPESPVL